MGTLGSTNSATNIVTAADLDPVAAVLGAADTAYEFETSSLTGLTAIGSPAAEDANSTVPGCLYYRDATSTGAWMGRFQASPSTPFTAVTKVAGFNPSANYNSCGLLVGVADPTTGALIMVETLYGTNHKILAERFTNRTSFHSTFGTGPNYPGMPVYLGAVVNSTTSIDCYWSMDGYVWRKFVSAYNPSLTVGSVGVAMKSENSAGAGAAFDFLRIWNSAKTFPG